MTARVPLLALALICLSTLFCTVLPAGTQPGAGEPLSDGQRIRTLDDLAALARLLPDGTMDREAFLAGMKSRPEFRAAGVSPDGSLWAQFSDGRLVVVPVVIVPSAADLPPTPEARRVGPKPRRQS